MKKALLEVGVEVVFVAGGEEFEGTVAEKETYFAKINVEGSDAVTVPYKDIKAVV